MEVHGEGEAMLRDVYARLIGGYPKFYKMDLLSKLGFVSSELLLQHDTDRHFDEHGQVLEAEKREDRAVILFNKSGSVYADQAYRATYATPGQYFPSPSLFVYTLPNIVTGEIAIRNGYYGETSFILLPQYDREQMRNLAEEALSDETTTSLITGWLECDENEEMRAELYIIYK